MNEVQNWMSRTELLYGQAAAQRLSRTRVLVAGLGAVGSFAVEALARSGVGEFILCDFDMVEASNINRQLYALSTTVGEKKAHLAEERVKAINPNCKVVALDCRLGRDNVDEIFRTYRPAVALDAIDSVDDKVAFIFYGLASKCTVVSSMGAARRIHPDCVTCGALQDVTHCPLAKLTRNGLKREFLKLGMNDGDFSQLCQDRLCCVYSTEPPLPSNYASLPGVPRAMGSSVCVTGTFGLLAASCVINAAIKECHDTWRSR